MMAPDERASFVVTLQRLSEDTSVLQDDEQVKALIAKIHRAGRKNERRAAQQAARLADRALRHTTAMVQRDIQQTAAAAMPLSDRRAPVSAGTLRRAARCYICKQAYVELHAFYHLLCPGCAGRNYARRFQRTDLTGSIALITGGRIKIGYQTALRMLRDGARVLVTTRFPADAARRFGAEPDYAAWQDRLVVYALDLRNLPAVEEFTRHLADTEPWLDVLINNAAQTVKRPLAFYRHLLEGEQRASAGQPALLEARADYPASAGLISAYFPTGALDADGQQVDKRAVTSWTLEAGDVDTVEMLEVQLVNAVAPFVLCSRLKPLLCRSPFERRFVVNVSAMEGQFERANKTTRHPHTNMAKAALNMLTRTAAADYARSRIYMNSVDTGWITDEKPCDARERVRVDADFYTPLDVLDGTARVYDPIARGLNEPGEPAWGLFLKDYEPYAW